ncbi:MAG: HNH endonuclease [Candidatus Hydrogenedentota bacterium]
MQRWYVLPFFFGAPCPTSDEVSALLEGPLDDALRPHSFAEFVGQSRVKTSLGEAMDAVRQADERMGHILLCGPAGLGKKALVRAIAYELGVGILGSISKVPAAALLELQDGHKPLAAHLVSLRHGQVLRIADIGNVQFTQSALEVLFRAMLNEPNRQSVRAESHRWFAEYDFSRSPFTLIATTKSMSEVPERLLPLFHHVYHLSRYSIPELTVLIRRAAEVLKVDVTGPAAELIAECAAGHTSLAAHLMLRTAQHGASLRADEITAKLAEELLWRLGLVRPELVDDDAAAREPIPHWMRRAVLDRDQGICRYCGQRAMTLQLDHIVPVSQGGHSTVANLVTACAECNLKKASRTPEEAGMTVLPAGSRLQ